MSYAVKEIFYSLQGEGANVGRPAVFCRFAGCNLWTGLERDRSLATCTFCDTDFVGTDGQGGGTFKSPEALADAVTRAWPSGLRSTARPLVICTGGEPLLQLDQPAVDAFRSRGFEVAVETNGTIESAASVDWLCVSPKAGTALNVTKGDELKLVFPQEGISPGDFEELDFDHFFLQPKDGAERVANTRLALEYCLANPHWRLSLQTHKLLGIP